MTAITERTTALTGHDQYLFREGTHSRLYEKLGAHVVPGAVDFAVWAPNAASVAVIGDWNGWDPRANPMLGSDAGIWTARVEGARHGSIYKFHVVSKSGDFRVDKSDPFAFRAEPAPRTGSVVWDLAYQWGDAEWMKTRQHRNALGAPCSVYELHLGSWRRDPSNPERLLGYKEVAPTLAQYVREMGFTHVELMPVMEHPFYGSWGYQVIGYFAPTRRHGSPSEFMAFVDALHRRGVGVILDWVPAHFPRDPHGLGFFDGTHLYEHADPREGEHRDWGTLIYNFGRNEVANYLLSSALFWIEQYHVDGLRVDAVASMLYRDYSREAGEWVPNQFGGNENLEAIALLKELNEQVHLQYPGVLTVAEESTAWGGVSRPTYLGGLGFSLKWNMGWMNDTLRYMKHEPIHRKYHHDELTFSLIYAFHENFVLPLSHDEVVHGKGSLMDQVPGDLWQKFGNLRLLFSYMWTHPGKKLLFMGGDFGQWNEWNYDTSLQWDLLQWESHQGLQKCVADLNKLYRREPALHQVDF